MSSIPHIKVSQVMRTEVHMIDPMTPVREAMRLMRQREVSSLVIARRDEHDELGLVVVSDIANAVIAKNLSPDRVDVYEIMSKPVITLDSDMDIRYAVRLLGNFGLSRGLVIDHQRNLVGIATMRDMVLAYVEQEEKTVEA
jgi:predicted transcriptional regulator|tara:strand:+ start:68 stop:490 length:423 start_codon:yes stop_codon:yes gene_type:complete